MKNSIIILSCLIFAGYSSVSKAQTIPTSPVKFGLNSNDVVDIVKERTYNIDSNTLQIIDDVVVAVGSNSVPASFTTRGSIDTNQFSLISSERKGSVFDAGPIHWIDLFASGISATWTSADVSNQIGRIYNNEYYKPPIRLGAFLITDGWQSNALYNLATGTTNGGNIVVPSNFRFPRTTMAQSITAFTNTVNYAHSNGVLIGVYTEPWTNTSSYGGAGCPTHLIETNVFTWLSWGVDFIRVDFGTPILAGDTYTNFAQRIYILRRFRAAMDDYEQRYGGNHYIFSSGWHNWSNPTDIEKALSVVNELSVSLDTFYTGTYGLWTNYVWRFDQTQKSVKSISKGHWLFDLIFSYDPRSTHPSPLDMQMKEGMHVMQSMMNAAFCWHITDSPDVYPCFTNYDLHMIDQDSTYPGAFLAESTNNVECWAKPLSGDRIAFALFNTTTNQQGNFQVSWPKIGLRYGDAYIVRNANLQVDVGVYTNLFSYTVKSNHASAFILRPTTTNAIIAPTNDVIIPLLTAYNAGSPPNPYQDMQSGYGTGANSFSALRVANGTSFSTWNWSMPQLVGTNITLIVGVFTPTNCQYSWFYRWSYQSNNFTGGFVGNNDQTITNSRSILSGTSALTFITNTIGAPSTNLQSQLGLGSGSVTSTNALDIFYIRFINH